MTLTERWDDIAKCWVIAEDDTRDQPKPKPKQKPKEAHKPPPRDDDE